MRGDEGIGLKLERQQQSAYLRALAVPEVAKAPGIEAPLDASRRDRRGHDKARRRARAPCGGGARCARALYHRLKSRRGPGKAIIAVASSMLGSIYHMLTNKVPYRDLGADHFDKKSKERIIKGCVRRLEQLGCKVELEQQAA